jgi:hypothetical protein
VDLSAQYESLLKEDRLAAQSAEALIAARGIASFSVCMFDLHREIGSVCGALAETRNEAAEVWRRRAAEHYRKSDLYRQLATRAGALFHHEEH